MTGRGFRGGGWGCGSEREGGREGLLWDLTSHWEGRMGEE